ncbi:MAG: hypothetical protein HQK49_20425 [Oligoflexia bacterium]|nr:hypothetical protein [Oligoflexia bacterium]
MEYIFFRSVIFVLLAEIILTGANFSSLYAIGAEVDWPFEMKRDLYLLLEDKETKVNSWNQIEKFINESLRENTGINKYGLEKRTPDQIREIENEIIFRTRTKTVNKNSELFRSIVENDTKFFAGATSMKVYSDALEPLLSFNKHHVTLKDFESIGPYTLEILDLMSKTFDVANMKEKSIDVLKELFSTKFLFSEHLIKILNTDKKSDSKEKFLNLIIVMFKKILASANTNVDVDEILKLLVSGIALDKINRLEINANNPLLITKLEELFTSDEFVNNLINKKISAVKIVEHLLNLSFSMIDLNDQQVVQPIYSSVWNKSILSILTKVIPTIRGFEELKKANELFKKFFVRQSNNQNRQQNQQQEEQRKILAEIKKMFGQLSFDFIKGLDFKSFEDVRYIRKEIAFSSEETLKWLLKMELDLKKKSVLQDLSKDLEREISRIEKWQTGTIGANPLNHKEYSREKDLIKMAASINDFKNDNDNNKENSRFIIEQQKGECPCCYNEESEENPIVKMGCSHQGCKSCLHKHFSDKLLEREPLKCIAKGCNHLPTITEMKKIFSTEECAQKEKFYVETLLREVKNILVNHGYYSCPTNDCPMSFKDITEEYRNLCSKCFKCPYCEMINCSKCKGAHNEKISCGEYVIQKLREQMAENIRVQLIHDPYYHVRPCPFDNCELSYGKTDNCDHVTCPGCNKRMHLVGGRKDLSGTKMVEPNRYSEPRCYRVKGDMNMLTGELYTKYTELITIVDGREVCDGHADQIIDEKHPYWQKLIETPTDDNRQKERKKKIRGMMIERKLGLKEKIEKEGLKLEKNDPRYRLFDEDKNLVWEL